MIHCWWRSRWEGRRKVPRGCYERRLNEGKMAAADATGLQAPGTITPSTTARSLPPGQVAAPPATTGAPGVGSSSVQPTAVAVNSGSPTTPPTNPLSTPAFSLPSTSGAVGSGVSQPPATVTGTAPSTGSATTVPATGTTGGSLGPAPAGQPTVAPSPMSIPPSSVPPNWTSSGNAVPTQPTPIPTGGSTTFRPRVR